MKTPNNRLCRTTHLFSRTPGGTVGGPGTFASLLHHNLHKTQLTMVSVSPRSGPSLILHTFFYSCSSRHTGKSQNLFHCSLPQLQSLPGVISPGTGMGLSPRLNHPSQHLISLCYFYLSFTSSIIGVHNP